MRALQRYARGPGSPPSSMLPQPRWPDLSAQPTWPRGTSSKVWTPSKNAPTPSLSGLGGTFLETGLWGGVGVRVMRLVFPGLTHRLNTRVPQGHQNSKESPMSPAHPGKLTDTATSAKRIGEAMPTAECEEGTSRPDDGLAPTTLVVAPRPSRPVSPARVGPSRNARPRQYNDPSNYLG